MKRFTLMILLLSSAPALATECPQGLPSCKVLILSPQEEAVLTAPNGVLATAAEARKVDYAGFAQYFLQKIKDAPAGDLPKPTVPPTATPSSTPTPDPDKKP